MLLVSGLWHHVDHVVVVAVVVAVYALLGFELDVRCVDGLRQVFCFVGCEELNHVLLVLMSSLGF